MTCEAQHTAKYRYATITYLCPLENGHDGKHLAKVRRPADFFVEFEVDECE